MKSLFAVASLMTVSMPIQAETVYLLIKSTEQSAGIALHSIPMTTMDQCEEAGALIISSERLDVKYADRDGFECIQKMKNFKSLFLSLILLALASPAKADFETLTFHQECSTTVQRVITMLVQKD